MERFVVRTKAGKLPERIAQQWQPDLPAFFRRHIRVWADYRGIALTEAQTDELAHHLARNLAQGFQVQRRS